MLPSNYLSPSDPPASASQVPGTTGMNHCTQLIVMVFINEKWEISQSN
jgi:hypothetical protein